jgi:photosystem II stability/assembly factor-like uncharacterized protein
MNRSHKTRIQIIVSVVMLLFLDSITASREQGRWNLITSDRGSHGAHFIDLWFADHEHGLAVTPAGLLKTMDGGRSWETSLRSGLPDKVFSAFTFADEKNGWIVGGRIEGDRELPLILRTMDGGQIWVQQAVEATNAQVGGLYGVKFVSRREGWAVGRGIILHTTDAGNTWEAQRVSHNREWLFSVDLIDSKHIWAVGTDGLILRTADGGITWSRQESPTQNYLSRIHFFGGQGWIVGSGRSLLLHLSGVDKKWVQVKIDTDEELRDVSLNGLDGWIVGSRGTILKTSDSGKTWRRQKSPTINTLSCLFFLDANNAWIGGDKRTLLRFSG